MPWKEAGSLVRSPRVMAAVASYVPRPLFNVAAKDAEWATRILSSQLEQHPVHVIIQRSPAVVQHLLQNDTHLLTMFDGAVPGELQSGTRAMSGYGDARRAAELRMNLPGDGSVTPTVYGSAHFATELRYEAGAPTPILNTGTPLYGGVGLVLKPSVLPRMTISHIDTFQTQPGDLAGPEHLADVLLRSEKGVSYDELGNVSSREGQMLHAIRQRDEPRLRELMDHVMLDFHGQTAHTQFVEVQIDGGIKLDDIAEIRFDQARRVKLGSIFNKGEPATDVLTPLAEAHGIPVRTGHDYQPE
ncbi:MAG: hypothetical protein H7123_03045 [Thermoleophilia bacterium]|nr:hypothetical protein [Thermoleophilia bacterium]